MTAALSAVGRARPSRLPSSLYLDEVSSTNVLRTNGRRLALMVGLGLIVWLGMTATNSNLFLGAALGVNIISAVGLNLIMGTAGILSLGSAVTLLAGGTIAAAATADWGFPLPVTLLIALLVGGVLGLLLAGLVSKLTGIYLALATLAVLFPGIFVLQRYLETKGQNDTFSFPQGKFLSLSLSNPRFWYFVAGGLAVVSLAVYSNLVRSSFGRSWEAMRDHAESAALLGVNVKRERRNVFVVSGLFAGVAGALGVLLTSVLDTDQYSLTTIVQVVAMVVIGGLGSPLGTALGAAFVTLLPNYTTGLIDGLPSSVPLFKNMQQNKFTTNLIVFGLAFVLFLLFDSSGLVGIWRRWVVFLRSWPAARWSQ